MITNNIANNNLTYKIPVPYLFKEIILVNIIDKDGNIKVYSKEELELGYRTSKVMENNEIVLSAVFKLEKGEFQKIKPPSYDGEKKEDAEAWLLNMIKYF